MKLTDNGLKAIKERHEIDAATYKKVGDLGWQSHRDRAALLEHIESQGSASKFGGALGSALGSFVGWVLGYLLLRWVLRDDLAALGAWLIAHIRVVS